MAFMFVVPQKAEHRFYPIKASETFIRGAAVYLDANEDTLECGADPTAILGFASHTAEVDPYPNDAGVFLAEADARFWITGSSDGSAVTTPTEDHLNQSYGLATASSVWYMDISETTATRVYVHKIDLEQNRFLVSVLSANRQLAP